MSLHRGKRKFQEVIIVSIINVCIVLIEIKCRNIILALFPENYNPPSMKYDQLRTPKNYIIRINIILYKYLYA